MRNSLLAFISLSCVCKLAMAAEVIQVTIPAHGKQSIFTAKNFAIITMTIAFLYIAILLIQVYLKKRNRGNISDSERSDSYLSNSSLYEDAFTSEYTNSQYLRSDHDDSLVDHQHFKYDQSLKDDSSREN